jgi:hypothetical protein
MNIDNLTYGQIKEIADVFSSTQSSKHTNSLRVNGKLEPVIVRCRDAGVHFGFLEFYEGRTVKLQNSRRLWKWKAKEGLALSGVAINGIDPSQSKIDVLVENILLLDACEIIFASYKSQKSILEA